jgi:hypothetical protein
MCGAKIVVLPGTKIWIGALIQTAFSTIFMLVFGFPKIMIAIFVTLILIGTALSAWLKARPVVVRGPVAQRPLARPTLFRILSFISALCALIFISILLFGFVIFMDSWNRWHQYEGQHYQRTDFVVKQAYYQARRKGNADIYASGTVEGNHEWMSLQRYVESFPRNQAELDAEVPTGTVIDVYYFPGLKGRSRVVVYDEVPPGEASRRTAMNAITYSPLGLAVTAGLIFLLSRLRRLCFAEVPIAMAAANSAS